MATFLMFGTYSSGFARKITSERTRKTRELIEKMGGRVRDIYALLGEYDVMIVADYARMGRAYRFSHMQ
ncbi:MAG: GYD domain-containing protein [Planctomycetota bacterium]